MYLDDLGYLIFASFIGPVPRPAPPLLRPGGGRVSIRHLLGFFGRHGGVDLSLHLLQMDQQSLHAPNSRDIGATKTNIPETKTETDKHKVADRI